MKDSTSRLYILEHPLMMLIGIILITIGYMVAKRKSDAIRKQKAILIYYTLGFVFILSRIPWSTWLEDYGLIYLQPHHFFLNQNAKFTNAIITGTSTNGPITAAKASPELMPKTAMATAMASSKLLLAAVNDRVVDCS